MSAKNVVLTDKQVLDMLAEAEKQFDAYTEITKQNLMLENVFSSEPEQTQPQESWQGPLLFSFSN